jgi:hypothetical protein
LHLLKKKKDPYNSYLQLMANAEHWGHFLVYPHYLKTSISTDAYLGNLLGSRLFPALAFLLHSTGELLGYAITLFLHVNLKLRRLLLLGLPVITIVLAPVLVTSTQRPQPPTDQLYYYCSMNTTNEINTASKITPESNASSTETIQQLLATMNQTSFCVPSNSRISDGAFLFSVTLFGLVHGCWTGFLPIELKSHEDSDAEEDATKAFALLIVKLGQVFGSSTAAILASKEKPG